MNFDKINEEWSKDAVIGDDFGEESRKIPKLQGKYMELAKELWTRNRITEVKLKELTRDKTEYYSGQMDVAELKERGWPVLHKRIMKADVPTYVETDPDIIKLTLRLGEIKDAIKYIDTVMQSLKDRNYQISNSIKWKMHMDGAR